MINSRFITIESGRDTGKIFQITIMSAAQAEKWAMRAILAMIQSGMEIPDDVAAMGMAGVAKMGMQAIGGIKWELAEPLLDDMMKELEGQEVFPKKVKTKK